MNTSQRIATYLAANPTRLTLSSAQRRRVQKKSRAEVFRVLDGHPMSRIARLRRRFNRKDLREQRRAIEQYNAPLFAWQRIVAPGPRPTGGARTDRNHPSRKHDLKVRPTVVITAPTAVTAPVPGQPRRRDRREAARAKSARLVAAARGSLT